MAKTRKTESKNSDNKKHSGGIPNFTRPSHFGFGLSTQAPQPLPPPPPPPPPPSLSNRSSGTKLLMNLFRMIHFYTLIFLYLVLPLFESGMEGNHCEAPPTPFDPEKMAFAAALAAAASNNSKGDSLRSILKCIHLIELTFFTPGLSDYLWSSPPMHTFPLTYPFWPKRTLGVLPSPFLRKSLNRFI